MKYLAFIFTIYIMALSAWPCCTDETSLTSSHEDLCLSASEHQNDGKELPQACSPFFHASTSHAFVASPANNKAPSLLFAVQNINYPEYDDNAISLFPGDIWQPPQLV